MKKYMFNFILLFLFLKFNNFAFSQDLITWGRNTNGQLGDGTTVKKNTPTLMNGIKLKKIASGYWHSIGIGIDGSLWAWGYNLDGAVGTGNKSDVLIPVKISNDNNWVEIAAGLGHSVAIKSDGSLWVWGSNSFGQLGDGSLKESLKPKRIGNDNDWKYVSCGFYHTLAIKKDGSLWAWGTNSAGQLGIGSSELNKSIPSKVLVSKKITQAACGGQHSLILSEDGQLYAFGFNKNGQLGNGTTKDSNIPILIDSKITWKLIGAGGNFSLAIDDNNKLWAWGGNTTGQLGDGTKNDKYIPTEIKTSQPLKKVVAGIGHTIAIDYNGELYAWGSNIDGQLGDGTTTDKISPTKIQTQFKFEDISAGYSYSSGILKNVNSSILEHKSNPILKIENEVLYVLSSNDCISKFVIYDISGKMIISDDNISFNTVNVPISLNKFHNGLYFIVIFTNSQIFSTKFQITR